MKEKTTSNMLIRAVPLDVWERVDRLCRRKGFKRRDFIEQAVALFDAAENGDGKDPKAERDRLAEERVDQIRETLKGYEGALKLKKSIERINKNLVEMGVRETQMNLFMELKKMNEDLDEIIGDYIPQHEIPDDAGARQKMGLPFEYCARILTEEEWEKTKARNEAKRRLCSDRDVPEHLKPIFEKVEADLKETMEKLKKQQMGTDENEMAEEAIQSDGLSEEEIGGEKAKGVMRENVGKRESHDSLSNEQGQENEKKREIKTAFFGRGFEGLDGE